MPSEQKKQLHKIDIEKLRYIAWLPERVFMGDLVQLARSIQEKGDVDVPLKVRKTGTDEYELVWGKRRLEAAKLAGLTAVSCIIEDLTDEEVFRQNAIENLHRLEKNCIEEAEFFEAWKKIFNVTYESIAKSLGLDKKYVYNRVALLSLPQTLKEKIKRDTKRSFGVYHGLLLLKLKDKHLQELLGCEVIDNELSTRELELKIEEITNKQNETYQKTSKFQKELLFRKKTYDLTLPFSEKYVNPLFPSTKIFEIKAKSLGKAPINVQRITFSTHTGTHMDSPHQFVKHGKKLEQFFLDKFFGKGVVLSTPKNESTSITRSDVKENTVRIFKDDIVLFYTGWYKYYGTEKYINHPYLSEDLVHWIVSKKPKIVGIDTPTLEKPIHMRRNKREYPIHKFLLSKDILIIEGLGNMENLAGKRVFVYALPVVFEGADAYPVKVVAQVLNS